MSDGGPDSFRLDQLARASRRAALLSILGLVIVLATIGFAVIKLGSLEEQYADLLLQRDSLSSRVQLLADSANALASRLSQSRCALAESRGAIEAFHQHRYDVALQLYDKALSCDPQNAYLLNLKAYAEFKLDRLDDAIRDQRLSLATDSSYAWGYFDLARFQCAKGPGGAGDARRSIARALELRPSLAEVMKSDGEFQQLCRDLVPIP